MPRGDSGLVNHGDLEGVDDATVISKAVFRPPVRSSEGEERRVGRAGIRARGRQCDEERPKGGCVGQCAPPFVSARDGVVSELVTGLGASSALAVVNMGAPSL